MRRKVEYPTTFIVSLDTLKWHLTTVDRPEGVSKEDFDAVMAEVEDAVDIMPYNVSNGVLKRGDVQA